MKSFKRLKEEILTDRVLVTYDEKLPVTLACDASPISTFAITAMSIAKETDCDLELSKLKQDLLNVENYNAEYSLKLCDDILKEHTLWYCKN